MIQRVFSEELEAWLKSKDKKTFASLEKVFQEKSFAILILLLMAIPALPIPTASHVFELIVMLLALEMIVGRQTVWVPKFLLNKELPPALQSKLIPFVMRRIRWFEKFSRPRFGGFMRSYYFSRVAGVVFLMLSLAAFMSLPFSGLDTLPALGAVIVALSVILGDAMAFVIGIVVGSIGIGLVVALGSVGLAIFKHLI